MAVTGAIFKTLTFNGESSRDYGVYITGEAVFNAPSRDVEMVTIPGRNGSFPLDHGRFENIEVTYPAGIYADNEADFADAISDFRNMLCSAKGYCRLEDDYNPDEYRMAIYKSGLEVDPALLKAGEFEITFECQPQRFLKSGETPVTMASGDTITNPTRFESLPEIQVTGYGQINFNGYKIVLNNEVFGDVILYENKNEPSGVFSLGSSNYANNGDALTVTANLSATIKSPAGRITYADEISFTLNGSHKFVISGSGNPEYAVLSFTGSTFNFTKGTSNNEHLNLVYDVNYLNSSYVQQVSRVTVTFNISYNASADTVTITTAITSTPYTFTLTGTEYILASARVNSTKSVLGNPTYIDCYLGEAYKIYNDEVIPLNRYIDLGTELPSLNAGSSSVTYDNTITDVKVAPRWWKV